MSGDNSIPCTLDTPGAEGQSEPAGTDAEFERRPAASERRARKSTAGSTMAGSKRCGHSACTPVRSPGEEVLDHVPMLPAACTAGR